MDEEAASELGAGKVCCLSGRMVSTCLCLGQHPSALRHFCSSSERSGHRGRPAWDGNSCLWHAACPVLTLVSATEWRYSQFGGSVLGTQPSVPLETLILTTGTSEHCLAICCNAQDMSTCMPSSSPMTHPFSRGGPWARSDLRDLLKGLGPGLSPKRVLLTPSLFCLVSLCPPFVIPTTLLTSFEG